jgi:putative transposon-encoded protein
MVKKSVRRIEISSKELKVNLEKLQEDVKKAYETMRKVLPSAIKDAEVKKFGNASHIVLPKEYTGKKATVLIKK